MVHAGLDILLGELRLGMLWTSATLEAATELVEDIFSASDSAILILNDLLHYEHMDAGTFQLEKTWKSLVHLLTGKYNWAIFLAKRKGINFIIKDETVVTPEGVIASFSEREDEGTEQIHSKSISRLASKLVAGRVLQGETRQFVVSVASGQSDPAYRRRESGPSHKKSAH